MKSLTVKIIIAVLAALIVAGSVFCILLATGVIEFSSVDDGDDDKKTSYVQKDKNEDEEEKVEKEKEKKKNNKEKEEDPNNILTIIEGKWGFYNDDSNDNKAFFAVIKKNPSGEYSLTKGLMWTDYLETGNITKVEKIGKGEYNLTVEFPTVDNEMNYIEGHTDNITINIKKLSSDKLIFNDTEFEKIKQENIEDYFKQFVNF